VERAWRSKWLGWVFLFVATSFAVFWEFQVPPQGYSLIAMGVAAGLMALRSEMGGREKWLWTIMLFAFAYVEVRAIKADRAKQDTFQSKLEQSFQDIGQGIKDSNAQSDRDFNAEMSGLHFALGRIGDSIKTQTGGDSFCYIDISPVNPEKNAVNHAAQMAITRVGKYPLHGISMTLDDGVRYSKVTKSAFPEGHIPTSAEIMAMWDRARQASTMRQPISDFATPDRSVGVYYLSGEDQESFQIVFSAFNGEWLERLELRRLGPDRWVKAMWVESPMNPYYVKIDPDYPRKENGEPDVNGPRLTKTGAPAWEKPKH
jgi:hypothetical protein